MRNDRDEIGRFAGDVMRNGVYVLGCGGGIIAEPRRAIRCLEPKYGRDRLIRLCVDLVFGNARGEDDRWIDTAAGVADRMLYHLADDALLAHLIGLRNEWRKNPPPPSPEGPPGEDPATVRWRENMGCLEILLAGISSRLSRPLPEGIRPLDPMDEYAWFLDGG